MHPIHAAQLDKPRPILVLTREVVRPHLTRVTVAPITTTRRGLSTELPVGPANGLEAQSVVRLRQHRDHPRQCPGRQIGVLFRVQEAALAEAIQTAFDLD